MQGRIFFAGKIKYQSGVKLIVTGTIIIALMVIISIFAPWLSRWGPTEIDFASFLSGPSPVHWFGTD